MDLAPISSAPLGTDASGGYPTPSARAIEVSAPGSGDQAWIEALPIAAAIVAMDGGAPHLRAHNRPFARLLGPIEERSPLTGILAALRAHPGGGRERISFAWSEPCIGGRHFQVHLAPLAARPGASARAMLTLVDRTAQIDTERSLRFEMLHDSLTGLPNRLAFAEALDATSDEGEIEGRFAVIVLDLARFSHINEGVGALAGDELVISVARRLVAATRSADLIARTAGDEFSVLVRLVDGPGDALQAANRLRAALARPIQLSDLELRIDCAIGCAVWHDHAATTADLLRNAQIALKRAKRSGRIEVYQAEEARCARARFSLETALRHAIDRDELRVAFQPMVTLEGNVLAGYEALARWEHPERGTISPEEFIAVAEESGLIVPLGRWMLDKALGTLAAWDRAIGTPLPCYMSVNLSPMQLQRDAVAPMVADALAAHGIGGERLMLELTENCFVADPARAATILDALKALRCRIAMDDFGTGYSNLASLQRLPIDVLKIDRGLVGGMLDDRDAAAIVRAILGLAATLGMETVAEGIESAPLARRLRRLGCTTGQGFHFASPLDAADALALAKRAGAAA